MNLDIDTFPTVQSLKAQVVKETGKDVEFMFEPLAPGVLGSQKPAHRGVIHHLITINKDYSDLRHSIASFQMRHILRRQRIKSEQKDLTHQDSAMEEVLNMASKSLARSQAEELAKMAVAGILIQLVTSVPGVLIHSEMIKEQGELAMQHKRMMTVNGGNNLTYLNPPNLPIPAKIFKWNKALLALDNFCFFKLTQDETLVTPFKMMGLGKLVEPILEAILAPSSMDLDNRELIDLVAVRLGCTDYFRWVKV